MRFPKYTYSSEDQLLYYEFTSVGKKGNIKKIVKHF